MFSTFLARRFTARAPSVASVAAAWVLSALYLVASPALAQRTVTTTGVGNGGNAITAVSNLHACTSEDMFSDVCAGAFQFGEDAATVESIVGQYRIANPSNKWGTSRVETSTGTGTNALFNFTGDVFGEIRFQQELRGNFVVVLSGRWASTEVGPGAFLRTPWSAYYLFDDVLALALTAPNGPHSLKWSLSDGLAPDVVPGVLDFFGPRGLTVDRVSLHIYDPEMLSVAEPQSLALAALALVVAWGSGLQARQRRRMARGCALAQTGA